MASHYTQEAGGDTEGGQYASIDPRGGRAETMVQASAKTYTHGLAKTQGPTQVSTWIHTWS